VPKLVGQKLAAAKRKLTAAHCKLGKVKKGYSTRVGSGKVQSQSPKAGRKLKNGTPVSVVVSRGPRRKK
jgi:serine/threonine-protein kinase